MYSFVGPSRAMPIPLSIVLANSRYSLATMEAMASAAIVLDTASPIVLVRCRTAARFFVIRTLYKLRGCDVDASAVASSSVGAPSSRSIVPLPSLVGLGTGVVCFDE